MPRGKRHYRVTEADALEAHAIALQPGARSEISNRNNLLSALGRPYHGYHRAIDKKVAALVQGVAINHGFGDGNKRTAMLLGFLLIERSGYAFKLLEGETDKTLEDFIVSIVEDHLPFDEIAGWYKARIIRP